MCDQCIYTVTREESPPAILNNNTHFEPRFYLLLTHKPHKKPDQNGPYDGGFIYLKVFLIFLTVFSDRNFRAENFFIAADFRTMLWTLSLGASDWGESGESTKTDLTILPLRSFVTCMQPTTSHHTGVSFASPVVKTSRQSMSATTIDSILLDSRKKIT